MSDLDTIKEIFDKNNIGYDIEYLDTEEVELCLISREHANVGGYSNFISCFLFNENDVLTRVDIWE